MQTVVLNTTFSFIFDSLREGIPKDVSLKALDAIFDDAIFDQDKAIWNQYQITEIIQQARKIVKHPCPQNRAEGNPYVRTVPKGLAQPKWRQLSLDSQARIAYSKLQEILR